MPKCVECGAETPRDEMRGAPDELRCEPCARKRYSVFEMPRRLVYHDLPRYRKITGLNNALGESAIGIWQR